MFHSVQPLFVAGKCFTDPQERGLMVELLREIENERGWATDYRVRQLLKEGAWDETRVLLSEASH